VPPAARRALIEELVPLFQHEYTSDIAISQEEIEVPKPEEPELTTAMAG
jgi:hypothetical protein